MGGDNPPPEQPPGTLLPLSRTRAPVEPASTRAPRAPLPPFTAGRPRAAWAPPIWVPPADDPVANGEVPPPPELEEPEPIGFGDAQFSEETLATALAQLEAGGAVPDALEDFTQGMLQEPAAEAVQESLAQAGPEPSDEPSVEPSARADEGASDRVGLEEPTSRADEALVGFDATARADEAPTAEPASEASPSDRNDAGSIILPPFEQDERRPADILADRLEKIAAELRTAGAPALEDRLHGGGRLDAVLASVLAGYLAGLEER